MGLGRGATTSSRAVIKGCNPKHLLWLSSLDVTGYQNGRLKVTISDMLRVNLQLLQLLQNLTTALTVVHASTDTSKFFQQFTL